MADPHREVRLGAVNVRVLIDGPSELVFDYAVPAGLDVRPGCRVRVPLRRKSATGTVLSMVEAAQMDFALRELESLIDPEPLITPVLLRTGEWIADYYGCGIETVIRSLLPEAVRSEENSAKTRRIAVLDAAPDPAVLEKLAKRAPRQHAILTLLAHAPDMRLAVADLGDGSAAALKAHGKGRPAAAGNRGGPPRSRGRRRGRGAGIPAARPQPGPAARAGCHPRRPANRPRRSRFCC